MANRPTRILCINCNVCVNKLRRYPALESDARVSSLLCSWVYPQIIAEDDVVCETCLDLARAAVNVALLRRDSDSNTQEAGPSRSIRTDVCFLCGCSIQHKQKCKIIRENATEMQQSIYHIIESRVAPREITPSNYVCVTCWLRCKREVERGIRQDLARLDEHHEQQQEDRSQPELINVPQQQPQLFQPGEIILPNYRRAANSNNHCVFPNCHSTTLHGIPDKLRAQIISQYRYYLPHLARICAEHLSNNMWDTLFESNNSIETFSVDHIQHVFSLVNAYSPTLDFENLDNMDDRICQYWLGFTKAQFHDIITDIPQLAAIKRGSLGLAALLLKMRTGDSDERISSLVQVPRRTLEVLMDQVRNILILEFVPKYLGTNTISRQELISRALIIPKGLYGENKVIVICDGTYIYINKSSNYSFQKQTYSLHKYKNLLKPFLIVACDGYVVDCFGPYKATTSDAEIMKELFGNENCPLRLYFRPNDTFILDKGFRDSISLLEDCGYDARMPDSLLEGEHQLTTAQANRSRCITICRWVVEAVNGHIKRDFKLLRQDYFHKALPHMMENFQIAVALLNKFGVRLRDHEYAEEMLQIICERFDLENNLANFITATNMNRRSSNFQNITADRSNMLSFPILDMKDLILFAVGTYQIRQARSYYGEHVRFHGSYRIEVCKESISASEFNLRGSSEETSLIRGKIKSRHVSNKQYYVYILIKNNVPGRAGIAEYCCSCLVGRRTVGCCAHTMTIVWYLGWARHQNNISAPAAFLDEVFIRNDDEDE